MRIPHLIFGSFLFCGLLNAQTATTTTLSSVTPASPLFGQTVTLTAQVSPAAPGTVAFLDGGALVGVGTLNGSGVARATTLTLATGLHSLRAVYGGSTGYSSSQSAAMPYTVTAVAASAFAVAANYGSGTNPGSALVADFNGDGKADLAVATSSGVSVLLGNGDGTFQSAKNASAGVATGLAAGDFDADGKMDLVICGDYFYVVLLGNGDGTFRSFGYSLPGKSSSVAVGDLNGDGKADLVVALNGSQTCAGVCTWSDGSIGVLLGYGIGAFGNITQFTVPGSPAQILLADVNGDGKTDIVAANLGALTAQNSRTGSGMSVLLGKGDGTLQTAVTYAAGNGPNSVAAADFNGDGKLDVAVTNSGDNSVSILAGNADGTFHAAVSHPIGASPASLLSADLNGDGKVDLVIPAASGVAVLYGNGDGSFATPVSYAAGAMTSAAVVGDFNGDNRADLAVTKPSATDVGVWLGIQTGGVPTSTSTALSSSPNPSQYGQAVTLTATVSPSGTTGSVEFLDGTTVLGAGTLNGSGVAQISTSQLATGTRPLRAVYAGVTGTWQPSQSSVVTQTVRPVATFGFIGPTSYVTGGMPQCVVAADFNNDGKMDLAVGKFSDQSVAVMLGNGDGSFQTMSQALQQYSSVLAVGDFNGDGKPDLFIAGNAFQVLLGNGDGTFRNGGYPYNPATVSISVAVADFNGDGKTDVVVALYDGRILILPGNGDGTFQTPVAYYLSRNTPTSLAVGDFNGDGKPDLALGGTSNSVSIFLGNGDGTLQGPVAYGVSNQVKALTTADFNGDGKSDLAVVIGGTTSNNLAVFLGNGDGTFQGAVSYAGGLGPTAVTAGDFNGDGKLDLAVANTTGHPDVDVVLLGNGDGTFQPALMYSGGTGGYSIAAADFNGDGRADLATANYVSNDISILLGSGTATTPSYGFVPMYPCRIVDTRKTTGPFGGPRIAGGTSRDFAITASSCGVSPYARAYVINVTVVPSGKLGYLTVWPSGQDRPLASTLNSLDGRIKANAAIVPAGSGGAISVFASDDTDVVIDINGVFTSALYPTAQAFYPVTPCRIADTRKATGDLGGPSLAGGQSRTFPILSASGCNIPSTALAYSLNFAAIPHGPLGYLTAWPTGVTRPVVASLNAPTGAITANSAIMLRGAYGSVDVFASDATDLVIDITGYFAPAGTGGLYCYNVTPCRVLDTRKPAGSQPFNGKLDVDVAGSPCGIPSDAKAHVLSATVVPTAALGYLTLWPQGQTQPVVSTLNALDGTITSNLSLVPTTNGSISAFASNLTHLVLDIFGYFAQ